MQAEVDPLVIVPLAISYDLVLEDHVLSRQGVKKRQRPFTAELAEMMRYAVGYRTRAFVTFGQPIAVSEYNPQVRRDVLDLAHRMRDAIGRVFKVTPTSLVASAMRPSISRHDLELRADDLLGALRSCGANLAVETGAQAVSQASAPLRARGVLAIEGDRFRVRSRSLLRYYAHMIDHLVAPGAERTH
jgi:glycerol-3-phosphate O-acyltransferase